MSQSKAEVTKSRSKKKPFNLNIIGENGEPISRPQLLTTRLNVKKNLLATMKAFKGKEILVHDFTERKYHPCRVYTLCIDGLEVEPQTQPDYFS